MSAPAEMLYVFVAVWGQRYAIRYDDIGMVRIVEPGELESLRDPRGRPLITRSLLGWFHGFDEVPLGRCHAVIVTMRRRSVALLVERVEEMMRFTAADVLSLPPLVTAALEHGWIAGVVHWDNQPTLVLDTVQIARDIVTAEIAPSG